MNVPKSSLGSPQTDLIVSPHENFSAVHLSITVPEPIVTAIYNQALRVQQGTSQPFGFHQREVPIKYVECNYQSHIIDEVTEFIFKFYVVGHLYNELRERKLLCADDPRLESIEFHPQSDAVFNFQMNVLEPIVVQPWKYFPFKAPRRKRYKDLDRQVLTFLKEEHERLKQNEENVIQMGDWVNLEIGLADGKDHRLLDGYVDNVWLKIGEEEVDAVFRDLLAGKKIGETFFTENEGLQQFYMEQTAGGYQFWVKVIDIQPYHYVCFEEFKQQFRLKTNKEMHQKLIEVFSYRNDISQRKAMIEEVFKLLLSKHPFCVPNSIVIRQEEKLLAALRQNPDYQVYKIQKDFNENVELLARKQVKENLLIDCIAFEDGLDVTHVDIKNYLNLTKRPKLQEFIYFGPLTSKIDEQEMPVDTQELMLLCGREKMLNYILYHLTKQ